MVYSMKLAQFGYITLSIARGVAFPGYVHELPATLVAEERLKIGCGG
jgi:hypothetical protein